jgi:hypothetical protein
MTSLRLFLAFTVVTFTATAQSTPSEEAVAQEYARGVAFMQKGDIVSARAILCPLADKRNYRDVRALCTQLDQDLKAMAAAHNRRFLDGMQAKQVGDLERAETLLRSVKYGNFVETAQSELREVISLREHLKGTQTTTTQVLTTTLRDLYDSWRDSYFKADIERLKQIEADDFVMIRGEQSLDRVAHLQAIAKRGLISPWFERAAFEVRMLSDDSVLVRGACERSRTVSSKLPDSVRFTQIWMRQGGGWHLLHMQESADVVE